MTAAAWDAWTREGAHPCYQVRLTGPSHDARSLVDMPSENVTELGAWQATLAAHDDMANGGATDPRRSADGWYEVAVWRVVGQQRIFSVILPPLARRRSEMDRARNEALAARSVARAVWAAGAVLALAVIACVLVALLVTGCARPSAPVVEVREGGGAPPAPSIGDPCDCAHALAACAPSGYRCGVGVACADGIPYRRTDAGIALVSRACPVPLTDRGRVVALCLDGDACVVDDAAAGGGVSAEGGP